MHPYFILKKLENNKGTSTPPHIGMRQFCGDTTLCFVKRVAVGSGGLTKKKTRQKEKEHTTT